MIFLIGVSLYSQQINNITKTSNIHERNATWSPNGEWIAYISDKTGTEEVWLMRPDGTSKTQLTRAKNIEKGTYRYELEWSPNSKYLLNSDNARNLTLIDVFAKTEKMIFHSATYAVREFSWSNDNNWIAYSAINQQGISVIYLYSLKSASEHQVTSEFYNSRNPVFSKDGKYLFFTSDRDFNAKINSLEWNYAYLEMSKIYGICLQNDVPSPFLDIIDYNNVDDKK